LKAATLQEFLGKDDKAEALYKRTAQSRTSTGYLMLAAYYKRSSQQAAALEVLENGLNLLPDSPEMILAYGGMLEKAGQFDKAIPLYVHLEGVKAGMGKPRLLMAHLRKGDFDAAKEIAEREVAANPSSVKGYVFLTAIYEYESKWQLAEQSIQKGLLATDNNLSLRMSLARLQNRRGEQDLALKTYNEILRDSPRYIPALFSSAAIHDVAGNKKQALNLYESILTLDKNHVPTLNNLAYLLMDVYSDNERALELAIKCFQLKSNDPRILDTLGYALLKNGQPDKSIIFLEKAASAMPEEITIQIHLARAYKSAGRNDEALVSLSGINTSNAQESQLQEVEDLLKELN
jgi:tetratricopeptide (TPR) repeat protein